MARGVEDVASEAGYSVVLCNSDAQVEKEKILSDARAEAQQEIHRLDDERQAAERKLQYAQEKTAEFIRRSEELCKAHSAFLLSLPELDFAPEGVRCATRLSLLANAASTSAGLAAV